MGKKKERDARKERPRQEVEPEGEPSTSLEGESSESSELMLIPAKSESKPKSSPALGEYHDFDDGDGDDGDERDGLITATPRDARRLVFGRLGHEFVNMVSAVLCAFAIIALLSRGSYRDRHAAALEEVRAPLRLELPTSLSSTHAPAAVASPTPPAAALLAEEDEEDGEDNLAWEPTARPTLKPPNTKREANSNKMPGSKASRKAVDKNNGGGGGGGKPASKAKPVSKASKAVEVTTKNNDDVKPASEPAPKKTSKVSLLADETSRAKAVVSTAVTMGASRACPSHWPWFSDSGSKSGTLPRPKACLDRDVALLDPAAAGGSLASVMRRLAARLGLQGAGNDLRANVKRPSPRLVGDVAGKAEAATTLQVGLMRDPRQRCLAEFKRDEKDSGVEANTTDAALLDYAAKRCVDVSYRHYDVAKRASGKRGALDFLGVAERLPESLLLLGIALGGSMGNLLHVDVAEKREALAQHSAEVRAWFHGGFVQANARDVALHRAANAALDQRIAAVGAKQFASLLADYKGHLDASASLCAADPSVAAAGTKPDCYFASQSCARACLDAYALEHDLWRPLQVTARR